MKWIAFIFALCWLGKGRCAGLDDLSVFQRAMPVRVNSALPANIPNRVKLTWTPDSPAIVLMTESMDQPFAAFAHVGGGNWIVLGLEFFKVPRYYCVRADSGVRLALTVQIYYEEK